MTFLIVVHVIICTFLVFVILLQPGKSDAGIGFGSSSQSIFGSKGAGNFLTKITSVCAIMFLVTSFILVKARVKEFAGMDIKDVPSQSTPPAAGSTPDKAAQAPQQTPPPAAAPAATPPPTKK